MNRPLVTVVPVLGLTAGMMTVATATAAAAAGLGLSLHTEEHYIALEDPQVHWAKATKLDGAFMYKGTGDGGRAHYDLTTYQGALIEVEGTVSASTEAQGVKLGEIQDGLAVPFAGKPEVSWYESQVQLVQAGTFPKATKVFGKVRVGLGFSEVGASLVMNVTVVPTDV